MKNPRQRLTTLTDVALAAGVDASTVSRILRMEPGYRVAAETRSKVMAVANELNYQPNTIARSLRTSRTFTLGIAVPQLENPVFPQLIFGAEAAAKVRGYSLLISHVTENTADELVYDKLARLARVDGLLVATPGDDKVLGKALDKVHLPLVVLNRKIKDIANYAVLDTFAAAKIAAEHLISMGHRHIAHLAGHLPGYNGKQRLAGFKAALNSAGIEFRQNMVVAGGYSYEGGVKAMQELLERKEVCTGLVAATMLTAAGAMKVLHDRGISIPKQMSVIAIHDATIADMLYPPLTTVRMPLYQLGHSAANGLIDLIEGRCSSMQLTLAPECVITRASTAPPMGRTG